MIAFKCKGRGDDGNSFLLNQSAADGFNGKEISEDTDFFYDSFCLVFYIVSQVIQLLNV